MTSPDAIEKVPVKKRRVAIVLLFTLAAVILLIVALSTEPPKSNPTAVQALNPQALKLVSYLVVDDIKTGMSGGQSASWKNGSFLGLIQIDRHATAKEYEVAYDANEIAADNEYKDKKILLSGDVVSIDKDFTETGVVTLRGSGFMGIHAELSANGMAGAASFVKGQHVDLVCDGTGRVMTIATLGECISFQEYLNGLSPSVESRLTDFLSGRTSLPKSVAAFITEMYVVGLHLSADSPCLNNIREKCESDMQALSNDKAKMGAIRSQTQQMMSSLKIN